MSLSSGEAKLRRRTSSVTVSSPARTVYTSSVYTQAVTPVPLFSDCTQDLVCIDEQDAETSLRAYYRARAAIPSHKIPARARDIFYLALTLTLNIVLVAWFMDLIAKRSSSIPWKGPMPAYSELHVSKSVVTLLPHQKSLRSCQWVLLLREHVLAEYCGFINLLWASESGGRRNVE